MTTNLPMTTNSTTASFSANTDSPSTSNTTTPVTSITSGPPQGPGSMRKRVFEEIKRPRTFFQYLQKMECHSADNLIHLQALLWHLDRKDLLRECVEYAKTARNTLYFHQPSPEPVNGYRYAEFHVKGRDLSNYKRKDLEELRFLVSIRLCVPPEFILISGVTPSKSLVITIMIPEYHAEILVELLKENSMTELIELAIDSVLIHGQTFRLIAKSKVVSSQERDETLQLFEKLERAQSLLDMRIVDILRLKKKLETAEKKHKTSEEKLLDSILTETNTERAMRDISELLRIQEEKGDKQWIPFEIESALGFCRSAVTNVEASGHDTDEIIQFLEANTYLVPSKTNDVCRQFAASKLIYMDQPEKNRTEIRAEKNRVEKQTSLPND